MNKVLTICPGPPSPWVAPQGEGRGSKLDLSVVTEYPTTCGEAVTDCPTVCPLHQSFQMVATGCGDDFARVLIVCDVGVVHSNYLSFLFASCKTDNVYPYLEHCYKPSFTILTERLDLDFCSIAIKIPQLSTYIVVFKVKIDLAITVWTDYIHFYLPLFLSYTYIIPQNCFVVMVIL